jgi:hypothetical protein
MPNLMEPAHVQYDDFSGSIAVDQVDLRRLEVYLGVDEDEWMLVQVRIQIYGGSQYIQGYAVSLPDNNMPALLEIANSGGEIELTKIVDLEWHIPNHSDTNPPAPESLPVINATQLLGIGFKRLDLILTTRGADWPEGTKYRLREKSA